MIAPENILDNLKCSQCHKYLSIAPVKVYPNREVKCGRCNLDGDHGIQSNLFNIITKDLTFPCINRFDGCNSAYPIAEMANHESRCRGGNYDCYFCEKFTGIAYDLNMHCQKYHRTKQLDNREFWIYFEKGNQKAMYYHLAGAQLFFIRYTYDADYKDLMLEITFVGKCFKGDIFYSFKLYSVENSLLYKTRPRRCSIMAVRCEEMVVINLSPVKIPKRFAICKFYIHDEPELVYKEVVPIIDDSKDTFTLRCTFSKLSEINGDNTELIYPAVFNFLAIPWRVILKRRLSLTDYKKKLGVYLQWFDGESSPFQSCKVSATFSVVAADQGIRISRSLVKTEFSPGDDGGRMLHDWLHIMNKENGFVKDSCLKVEVNVKIYIPVANKVVCHNCGKDCFYCKV